MKKAKLIIITVLFLVVPSIVGAQTIGQENNFNIDPSYDLRGRSEVSAALVKITNQLYFYVDKDWWQGLDWAKRQSLDVEFYNLSVEFERKIYLALTSFFGSEPKPGIDGDEKITVLIHPMEKEAGGYFNSGDVYPRLQNPKSNQREMVYLNSQYIDKPEAKSLLAHEFVHLIIVNQKDILRGVVEEAWLNETRAEYALTLLGYDDVYKGSNLEKRVKAFLEKPSDSLTEWLNKSPDYGIVNLFTQYLVDHYGVKILNDSLQSNKTGIESINYALEKSGFKKDFSQIFADWTIAILVNDCSLGERYCYLNKNLKDLRITPTLYYLPLRTESVLSTFHSTTNWSAIWHKFIGGGSNLILEFDGADFVEFKVPYLLCDSKNDCSVDFLFLDENQQGKITISGFSAQYGSLTIMPFIHSKISGFNGRESFFSFSWKVTIEERTAAEKEAELISRLLAQIEALKRQVAEYEAKIAALLAGQTEKIGTPKDQAHNALCARPTGQACTFFENNLYYGMSNNPEVSCLQEFLKVQGSDIYPEGLVTGNFLSLTQQAVIRFQEKYASEILKPLGLEKGTGYVGEMTRSKINQILGY